jgi:hypothetical protein
MSKTSMIMGPTEERPYWCKYCNYGAKTLSQYNNHLHTMRHYRKVEASKKLEEEEEEENLEYTEEEIAYNKIDDVMFNKKCLNTEMKNNVILIKEEEEEEEEKEEEFTFMCPNCEEIQDISWCFRCGVEEFCNDCDGPGGDYGRTEEWVCDGCLPTCLEPLCGKVLYTRMDECCGAGRSDDTSSDEEEGEEEYDYEEEDEDEDEDEYYSEEVAPEEEEDTTTSNPSTYSNELGSSRGGFPYVRNHHTGTYRAPANTTLASDISTSFERHRNEITRDEYDVLNERIMLSIGFVFGLIVERVMIYLWGGPIGGPASCPST